MAKVIEKHIVIKLSKLIRNGDPEPELFDNEDLASLEAVIGELLGDRAIVEVVTE